MITPAEFNKEAAIDHGREESFRLTEWPLCVAQRLSNLSDMKRDIDNSRAIGFNFYGQWCWRESGKA